MGLPLEWQENEIVLKVRYKVKPGMHPHAFFQKYGHYNLSSSDNSFGKIDHATFIGINYGFPNISTPIERSIKSTIKRRKRGRPRKAR